jgi:DNA-binding transcriptional ArsR family regulator
MKDVPMPTNSHKEIIVRTHEYREGDAALLCGIANAGGGRIVFSPGSRSRSKNVQLFKKTFETIPRLSREFFNLPCETEPIMDGIDLALEVRVPAADRPLSYQERYYLYTNGANTIVSKAVLKELFEARLEAAQNAALAAEQHTQLPNGAEGSALPLQQEEHARLDSSLNSEAASEEANQATEASNTNQEAPASSVVQSAAITTSEKPAANTSSKKHVQHTPVARPLVKPAAPSAQSAGHKTVQPSFKETSIAAANGIDLTSTDEFILKVLETNGRVTALRIAEVLGVSESTVRRSFRRLREYELIERIGSNKAGYWRLVD